MCVTVVDGVDRDAALKAIGAVDTPTDTRVNLTSVGTSQILVETESSEGVRPEVLRRASVSGWALAWAKLGDGRSTVGYAENGTVVAVFEPPGPGCVSPEWAVVAERLGIDSAALPAESAASWAAALFGAAVNIDIANG